MSPFGALPRLRRLPAGDRSRRRRVPVGVLPVALSLAACGAGGSGPAGTVTDAGARGGPASAPVAAASRAPESDWPTFGANAARTGAGAVQTGITAANLRQLRARVVYTPGTVDAAPVELAGVRVGGRRRDIVMMTTTYGRTFAIDAGTGQRLWQFTPRSYASVVGSGQVTTATPVTDPDRRWLYTATPDGFIHKLSVTSGRDVHRGGWPARITFDAHREKIAGALNLAGTSVIAVTGGYIGDAPVYQGHVVTLDRASGRVTHVFNSLCSNLHGLIDPPRRCGHSASAIWAREGAIVEPGSGRIVIATGNGDFNGVTDWGNAVLELSSGLRLLHAWAPRDTRRLSDNDTDVGSTGPALVTVGGRRLALQGGKAGRLDLLDLDRLNGTTGGPGPRLGGELGSISSPGGGEILTSPAVWSNGGRTLVVVADDQGTAAYAVSGGVRPHVEVAWQNETGGTSPVIAGGLLYVYEAGSGDLHVYVPSSGRQLASFGVPHGHWNSPIVAGGRVILPTGSYHDHSEGGEVIILHLPGR